MSQPIYKPVPDGVYQNKGSLISVGQGQSLAISEKKPRMNIWVGELPDGWKVCEAVEAPKADWSQAPDWAEWWTIAADGCVSWYATEPVMLPGFGEWGVPRSVEVRYDGMIEIPLGVDWRTLKERRPEAKKVSNE